MTRTEHIQTTGLTLGTTTIIQLHGTIEAITTHGDTDTVHGAIDMTLGTIDTIRGTTDTTHGIMEDIMVVSTTLGTITHGTTEATMADITIHITTTCTHITAVGTEDGILTMAAYITDHIMGLASVSRPELQAEVYSGAHASKPQQEQAEW